MCMSSVKPAKDVKLRDIVVHNQKRFICDIGKRFDYEQRCSRFKVSLFVT